MQIFTEHILPQPLKKVRIRSKLVNRESFTKLLGSDNKAKEKNVKTRHAEATPAVLPIPKILLLFRTIQMKTAELYFLVVPFVSLFKEVLAFESVDEILTCDHSNETYQARLFKAGLTL